MINNNYMQHLCRKGSIWQLPNYSMGLEVGQDGFVYWSQRGK